MISYRKTLEIINLYYTYLLYKSFIGIDHIEFPLRTNDICPILRYSMIYLYYNIFMIKLGKNAKFYNEICGTMNEL